MVAWDYIFSHKIFDLCYNRLMNGHEVVQKFLNVGQMSPIISGSRYQAPTTSGSVTGDVILPSTQRSKSKPWKKNLVIGIMVVAVIVVVAILLAQYFSRPSLAEVKTAYDEYLDYMENGPRNDDGKLIYSKPEGAWFFLTLFSEDEDYKDLETEGDQNEDQYTTESEYLNELWNRYQSYNQKQISGRLAGIEKAELSDASTHYGEFLRLMIMYCDPDILDRELISQYFANGIDGANLLIEENIKYAGDAENVLRLTDLLRQIAKKEIALIELFNADGCIDDGAIIYNCDKALENGQIDQNFDEQNRSYEEIDEMYAGLKDAFEEQTSKVSNILGISNE